VLRVSLEYKVKVKIEFLSIIYSKPKYVSVTLVCTCPCGVKRPKESCQKYGTIHVTCGTCGEQGDIRIDRDVLRVWFQSRYPNMKSDIKYFCDRLEKENMGG